MGTFVSTLGSEFRGNRPQRYIRRHLWHQLRWLFGPKGTSIGTLGDGFRENRSQGYIHRHPWQRFRPISAPEVHPPAPLATDSWTFGPKGTSAGTLGSGYGGFSALRVHLPAPLATAEMRFLKINVYL